MGAALCDRAAVDVNRLASGSSGVPRRNVWSDAWNFAISHYLGVYIADFFAG